MTLSDAFVAKDGPVKAARSIANEKMTFYQGKGDEAGQAAAMQSMASASAGEGDLKEAARLSKDAHELFKKVGDKKSAGSAMKAAAMAQLFGEEGADAALASAQQMPPWPR